MVKNKRNTNKSNHLIPQKRNIIQFFDHNIRQIVHHSNVSSTSRLHHRRKTHTTNFSQENTVPHQEYFDSHYFLYAQKTAKIRLITLNCSNHTVHLRLQRSERTTEVAETGTAATRIFRTSGCNFRCSGMVGEHRAGEFLVVGHL